MRKRPSGIYPFEETLLAGHEYRVISLHPVSAWAVMFGGKDVENRSCAEALSGRVLVHAAAHQGSLAQEQNLRAELSFLTGIGRSDLPRVFLRNAILGSVEIVDYVQEAASKWAVPEHMHCLLREPRPLGSPVLGVVGERNVWRWTFTEQSALRTNATG